MPRMEGVGHNQNEVERMTKVSPLHMDLEIVKDRAYEVGKEGRYCYIIVTKWYCYIIASHVIVTLQQNTTYSWQI
jgi:hypothetical protein